MPPALRGVDRQSATAPDELEIVSSLIRSHLLKDPPETAHNLMRLLTVGVGGDRSQSLRLDRFLSARPDLHGFRSEVGQQVELVTEDLVQASLDGFGLLACFGASSLEHERDKLLDGVL